MNTGELWNRALRTTGAAAGVVGLALASTSAWGGIISASAKSINVPAVCASHAVDRDTKALPGTIKDEGNGLALGEDKHKDKDKDCPKATPTPTPTPVVPVVPPVDTDAGTTTVPVIPPAATNAGTTTVPVIPPAATDAGTTAAPVAAAPVVQVGGVKGVITTPAPSAPVAAAAPLRQSFPATTPNTGAQTPLEGGLLLMFGGISLLLAGRVGKVATR